MDTGTGSSRFARTLTESAPKRRAGVPNTLPPQDWNRNAEFGRVGCSVPSYQQHLPYGPVPHLLGPWHRTDLYNMIRRAGQNKTAHYAMAGSESV